MIRTIVWFIYFWLHLLFTVPALLKARHLDKRELHSERDQIVLRETIRWSRTLVNLTGSKINVKGKENIPDNQPVLFVSNHQGNFDIPILLGFLDRKMGFISKLEIKKYPIISHWMSMMRCVFMDRKNIRQSVKAINLGINNIKEGHSLVIFPEGTRSKGNAIGEFKPGSFKLATKSGVPIVPVTINGSYKIMEANKNILKGANVEVIISKPISKEEYDGMTINDLATNVQNIIEKELV
ncbi:lysophospholipid acyltransferase family protein [Cytobacillus sp. Hm23]